MIRSVPTSYRAVYELASFRRNITSQFGEDGIFEELFKRIGPEEGGIAVEVGAWDGVYCSNTWNLWKNKHWEAILIEGDKDKHDTFVHGDQNVPNVTAVHAFVTLEGPTALNSLLAKHLGKTKGVDLLSIDVDGDDYYIWESLTKTTPRVVVIEYNPTVPPHLSLVQKKGEYFGASIKALLELGKKKGYELIAVTETNCIFLRSEELEKANLLPVDTHLALPPEQFSYVVSSYDGTTMLTTMPMFTQMDRPLSARRIPRIALSDTPLIPVYIKRLSSPVRMAIRPVKRMVRATLEAFGLLPFAQFVRELVPAYKRWRVHVRKERAVCIYQKKYSIQTFVETGTYRGDMVQAMRSVFPRIHSIELGDHLCAAAKQLFKDASHITIHCGDSAEILPQILSGLHEPALFWLDAHYSHGDTARADIETPIEKELQNILNHSVSNHIILIDDARCFDGTHDYPTLEEVRAIVHASKHPYELSVSEDILRITPSKSRQ